jgi:hypothetical protein
MALRVVEQTGNNILVVDPTHLAARLKYKPIEILGATQYAMEGSSGNSLASGVILASFANMQGTNGNAILIKNVGFGLIAKDPTVGGLIDFAMFINRSLTANDTGGTVLAASGVIEGRKRSTVIGGSTAIDCRLLSGSTALLAGTYTADVNPIRILTGFVTTSGTSLNVTQIPPSSNNLFSCQNSGYPIILAPGEGFNIKTYQQAWGATMNLVPVFVVDCLEVTNPWT